MATDHCRSCGAAIMWVRSAATGGLMPLDYQPTDDGTIELDENGHAIVHHQRPMIVTGPLFVSHFATCPDAPSWRKS